LRLSHVSTNVSPIHEIPQTKVQISQKTRYPGRFITFIYHQVMPCINRRSMLFGRLESRCDPGIDFAFIRPTDHPISARILFRHVDWRPKIWRKT
jgi:hypothetical protein